MIVSFSSRWTLVAVLAAFGSHCSAVGAQAPQQNPRGDDDAGVQVLTRGPVHEAFAETVAPNPEPGMVVAKAPPKVIEELPPDQKPEGDNVAWISGYWAWDDERDDFIWNSGIWRVLPPGRQWVAGYWGTVDKGFQWVSGYWANADATEVAYLPQPPESLEAGPNTEAPSPDNSWAPGNWLWQGNRYAWRPGYWAEAQPNWVWTPAHYVSTPRGYVFVDGYHDYSVARRGVLFAPVYMNSSVYSRPGYAYSPRTAIDLSVFTNHLFVRPRSGHYYYGDYYSSNYSSAGFLPWFSSQRRGWDDPLFAQQRWEHRQDRDWGRRLQANYRNRRDHVEARPSRTWTTQTTNVVVPAGAYRDGTTIARPFNEIVGRTDSPLRFRAVDQQERQTFGRRSQEIQKFRSERQRLESTGQVVLNDRASGTPAPIAAVRLPASPIVARPINQTGRTQMLPKPHVSPDIDAKATPLPRGASRETGNARTPSNVDRSAAPARTDQPKTQPRPIRVEASPRSEPVKAQPRPDRPAAQSKGQRKSEDKAEPKGKGQR